MRPLLYYNWNLGAIWKMAKLTRINPEGPYPDPHKDTEGTLGDSHANFQLHGPNGLGGDSGQRPKNGSDFPANSTKNCHNSVKNGPIDPKCLWKVQGTIPEVDTGLPSGSSGSIRVRS